MPSQQVCPLLGLLEERGAYLTYPSFENRCYAPGSSEAIPLNEQTFFCLGGNKERCPRFQARQAAPAAAAAAASARSPYAPPLPEEESPSGAPAEPEPVWSDEPLDSAAADGAPEAELVYADSSWASAPPSGAFGATGGAARRPVWPLLLAAGTLVVVLMLCGFAFASLFGLRTLRAQLALGPTTTPIIERGTLAPGSIPFTGTVTADGFVIVVITRQPADAATAQAGSPTLVATPTPTETPWFTDTPVGFNPTPTEFFPPSVFETPTERATPTPRDTPTPFPTFPPATPVPPATSTPVVAATSTPVPSATFEPFVLRFVAEPTSIFYGAESTLTWEVRGVKAFFLDGEPMSGPTGSRRVKPLTTTTYVLRVIKADNSVQEVTQTVTVSLPTPTPTPTATPYPYYRLPPPGNTTANINGSGCVTLNGCAAFTILVGNQGSTPFKYRIEKSDSASWPSGWVSVLCWGSTCVSWDKPAERSLAVGATETFTLNFSVPELTDGLQGTVTLRGYCVECGPNPFFEQRFTATISTAAATATPTPTLAATSTPTPTPTATGARSMSVTVLPGTEATINSGSGCNAGDGCQVFNVVIQNTGSSTDSYIASLSPLSVLSGWDPNLCVSGSCFTNDTSDVRTLAAGASDQLAIRMRLNTTPSAGQQSDFRLQVTLTNNGPTTTRDLRVRFIE
jgi:hypothetical protein